jgi:hypothetical protein
MGNDWKATDGSVVGMTLELEDVTIAADASFSEHSLAAKDSLALYGGDADEGLVLQHALPDVAGKHRRRRRGLMVVAGCLLIGIIVLTTLLTKPESSDGDSTVHDGNDVGLVESDNVFLDDPIRPPEYYVLAPLVSNPEALFIPDSPEGDAFGLISREGLASDLDIVQRYALMNLFFATEGGSWTNFEGWSTRKEVCDSWVGVTCQNLVVTGIDLGKLILGTILRALMRSKARQSSRDAVWLLNCKDILAPYYNCRWKQSERFYSRGLLPSQ